MCDRERERERKTDREKYRESEIMSSQIEDNEGLPVCMTVFMPKAQVGLC